MPYPLPLTRTEAYLAYKAGVIQQSDLKPSLAVPRNGIDAWLAYWTGLAADYPKREDGTPHILQEEEAYIAYLCGVINEYPEKCLRRVGAYLRYLISARWGRPDHPLNREELYLSLIKTQFIPSGDPSSDIEIDGTAKAQFVDVKMYGDTFQQSYTGKNLLNINASVLEQDKNGIKITYEQETGIITINGTCSTDNTTFGFFASSDEPRQITVSGDVTVSYSYISGSITNATEFTKVQIQNNTYGNAVYVLLANSDAHTTANKNDTYNRNNIRIDSGVVFDNYKIKVMVELGATATAYEPYVGGIQSPNPDYPQPIQTVTGLQKVNVRGKNLFSMYADVLKAVAAGEAVLNVTNGSLVSITDNSIETSATAGDSFITVNGYHGINPNFEYKIPIMPSTEYVFSYSATGWTQYIVRIFDENNTQLQEFSNTNTGNPAGDYSRTFTSHESAKWLGIRLDNESYRHGETKAKFYDIQLEEGSSKTSYEPYLSNDYYINLGKNLFDKSKQVSGWLNGTGGISQPTSTTDKTSDYMACSPNASYTLSSPGYYLKIAQYDANKTFIKLDQSGNNIPSLTVNTAVNAAYIRISYGNAQKEPNVQFEAGSVASAYAPYFEPIELCKFGTYQDYIWKDQDQWKIHKETFKHQFDGLGDSWNYASSTTHALQDQNFNVRETGAVKFDVPGVALSREFTYFPNPGGITTTIPNGCIGFQTSGQYYATFRNDAVFTTKEDAIAWIRANKPTAYWALATATDTVITNQTLIDQLEALVKGGSEEGTTYIKLSTPDPNLPGLLYVEAAEYV